MSNIESHADHQRQESLNDPAAMEQGFREEETEQYQEARRSMQPTITDRSHQNSHFIKVFRFWSILGFTSTLMCTWPSIMALLPLMIVNGGIGGFVWDYIGTMVAMMFIVASLAEISATSSTQGGVYFWIRDYEPAIMQKYLTYLVGWTTCMAWQAGTASLVIICAQLLQGIIIIWKQSYSQHDWHITLFTALFVLMAILFNTTAVKLLPVWHFVVVLLHHVGILILLVPLWLLAPKRTAVQVFQGFSDQAAWGNVGLACVAGQVGPLFALSRFDAGSHLADKIRFPPRLVSCSVTTSFSISALLGLTTVLTAAFGLPDIQQFATTTRPLSVTDTVVILSLATRSRSLATFMSVTLIVLLFGAGVSALSTATRHVFTFSRDDGLPFPGLWRKIVRVHGPTAENGVPVNAFYLASLPSLACALLVMAYPNTLSCCMSLFIASILTGYAILLGCVLVRRLTSGPISTARRSLGRYSLPINSFAFVYTIYAFAVSQLPISMKNLSPATANWSPLIWFVVVTFASVLYAIHGRYVFQRQASPDMIGPFASLSSSRAA